MRHLVPVILFLASVAGCTAPADPGAVLYPVNRHLVNGERVTIEITSVNGTQAPDGAVEAAIETFANYVAGEVVVRHTDPLTLEADADGLITETQLEEFLGDDTVPPSVIRMLLVPDVAKANYRGIYIQREDGGQVIYILGETIDRTMKILNPRDRWQLVITHELCHALNVPASADHVYAMRHCTNPNCVLYAKIDSRSVLVGLLRAGPPMDLCAQCRQEIRAAQEQAGGQLVSPDEPHNADEEFRELLALNRQRPTALNELFLSHVRRRQFGRAEQCCQAAGEEPGTKDHPQWFWNRAVLCKFRDQPEEARRWLDRLVESMPDEAAALNNLAWEVATNTGPEQVHDGDLAVRLATRACELTEWKNAKLLDTLAAAYADAGDFDEAVKYQRKALQQTGRRAFSERLELYQAGKPYRRTP